MIKILFELDKDTKRTRRFAETATKINDKDVPAPACGTIYVQKWALEKLGDTLPDEIKVTIERID